MKNGSLGVLLGLRDLEVCEFEFVGDGEFCGWDKGEKDKDED